MNKALDIWFRSVGFELKIGAVRDLKSLHAHANDDTELAEDDAVVLFELLINLYPSTSS